MRSTRSSCTRPVTDPPYHWPDGKIAEGKEQQPVANVSWDDAVRLRQVGRQAFADRGGMGARLPRLVRGQGTIRGVMASRPRSDARFNSVERPAASGASAKRNAFRTLRYRRQRVGVVRRLVRARLLREGAGANPAGPAEGKYRVIRGGSWADEEKYLTCAYRSWARPKERSPNIGFRCVKPFHKK